MAQLVERSLPTPEICGSNPNIGKFYLPFELRTAGSRKKELRSTNCHIRTSDRLLRSTNATPWILLSNVTLLSGPPLVWERGRHKVHDGPGGPLSDHPDLHGHPEGGVRRAVEELPGWFGCPNLCYAEVLGWLDLQPNLSLPLMFNQIFWQDPAVVKIGYMG